MLSLIYSVIAEYLYANTLSGIEASQIEAFSDQGNSHAVVADAGGLKTIGTVGGKTYFTDYSRNHLTWMEAAAFCNDNRMRVATIESEGEDKLIINEASERGNVWFWLSAYRFFDDDVFYWLPSQTKFIYAGWLERHPESKGSNCVYVGASGSHSSNKGWFNNIPTSCGSFKYWNLFPLCESR